MAELKNNGTIRLIKGVFKMMMAELRTFLNREHEQREQRNEGDNNGGDDN